MTTATETEPQLGSTDGNEPPSSSDIRPGRLSTPPGSAPLRMQKGRAIGIILVHLLSLLVLVPWLFSWTGVILLFAGHVVFGMFGITIGYHRLLTHRGFTCPRWFEHTLAILGLCNLQEAPARWVSVHRKHHQHSDEEPDPHTPRVTFFWSHAGWLLTSNREHNQIAFYDRYAKDLMRDPFYLRLERGALWVSIYAVHALVFMLAGFGFGWATSGEVSQGYQLAASWLVWGVFARTVFVWHVTWAVNSLTHLCGYRNYKTGDDSRNFWLVALLAHGEGWHNNHHAYPRAANHGHRWWEFDISYLAIRFLEMIGLAKNVVRQEYHADSPRIVSKDS